MPAMLHNLHELAVLAQQTALVAGEAVLLYCLSRILFVWALEAAVMGGHGGGWVVKLLRTPGNMVHEVSHAAGYLIFGFRVKALVPAISDPQGRGLCRPGKAWSPLAFPWLATAAAALMPLLVGALVLRGLASCLQIPFTSGPGADGGPGPFLLGSLKATLWQLHYHDWRTWAFLLLCFSVSAELAPSDTDLRRGVPAIVALSVGLLAAALLLGGLRPHSPAWLWFRAVSSSGLHWLAGVWAFGLLATGVAAVFALPAAVVFRRLRRALRARR